MKGKEEEEEEGKKKDWERNWRVKGSRPFLKGGGEKGRRGRGVGLQKTQPTVVRPIKPVGGTVGVARGQKSSVCAPPIEREADVSLDQYFALNSHAACVCVSVWTLCVYKYTHCVYRPAPLERKKRERPGRSSELGRSLGFSACDSRPSALVRSLGVMGCATALAVTKRTDFLLP